MKINVCFHCHLLHFRPKVKHEYWQCLDLQNEKVTSKLPHEQSGLFIIQHPNKSLFSEQL